MDKLDKANSPSTPGTQKIPHNEEESSLDN